MNIDDAEGRRLVCTAAVPIGPLDGRRFIQFHHDWSSSVESSTMGVGICWYARCPYLCSWRPPYSIPIASPHSAGAQRLQ